MTGAQRTELSSRLRSWVESHPRPDRPTIVYLGRDYSPKDILEEVEAGTLFGESLSDFLFDAARRFDTSVGEFISRAIEVNKSIRVS